MNPDIVTFLDDKIREHDEFKCTIGLASPTMIYNLGDYQFQREIVQRTPIPSGNGNYVQFNVLNSSKKKDDGWKKLITPIIHSGNYGYRIEQ